MSYKWKILHFIRKEVNFNRFESMCFPKIVVEQLFGNWISNQNEVNLRNTILPLPKSYSTPILQEDMQKFSIKIHFLPGISYTWLFDRVNQFEFQIGIIFSSNHVIRKYSFKFTIFQTVTVAQKWLSLKLEKKIVDLLAIIHLSCISDL